MPNEVVIEWLGPATDWREALASASAYAGRTAAMRALDDVKLMRLNVPTC